MIHNQTTSNVKDTTNSNNNTNSDTSNTSNTNNNNNNNNSNDNDDKNDDDNRTYYFHDNIALTLGREHFKLPQQVHRLLKRQ